jgi:drug/metabolite transporter (DMT)-like permease
LGGGGASLTMPGVSPTTVPEPSPARARAMVVLLGVCWGLNWIAVRVALDEIRPWSLRCLGMGLGGALLIGWAALRGDRLGVPAGPARRQLAIAGLLNVAAFGVFTAFAQLSGSTSRVTMVAYTMPIWSVVFARFVLGERLDAMRVGALGLAVAGLAVLVAPLARTGTAAGIGWALAAGLAWAAGTVYLKRARVDADPVAVAVWQLAAGFVAVAIGAAVFEGAPQGWPQRPATLWALAYHVALGMALPYLLWFAIVRRLPASSAALGTLLVPVVAVVGAVALLGERPGPADAVGFTLIFAAVAAVLMRPVPPAAARSTDPAHPAGVRR